MTKEQVFEEWLFQLVVAKAVQMENEGLIAVWEPWDPVVFNRERDSHGEGQAFLQKWDSGPESAPEAGLGHDAEPAAD